MQSVGENRNHSNNKDFLDKNATDGSDYHYWQSQSYQKSLFRTKSHDQKFLYYDTTSVLKFLFFHWIRKWAKYTSNEYVEPYKLHPLPVSDQILYWQPIFSKHVSDGLVKLESYETLKSKSDGMDRSLRPDGSILFRALLLTFWKRLLFVLVGIVSTNLLSMSISLLLKRLLKLLNNKSSNILQVLGFIVSIILLQLTDGLIIDNVSFYMYRLICIIQYSFSITTFQNGLCCRRKYFNNIEGYNSLNVCNSVVHSCHPDSECSKNPLFCPALRYQNMDLTTKIFTFQFNDSYFVSVAVESLKFIVEFLSNFFYGIYLISCQVKVNIWYLYVVGLSFIVLIVTIEIINAYILHYILHLRDYRVSKSTEILPFLNIIYKMLIDDIAINFITKCRNNELIILFSRNFLIFLNTSLYVMCTDLSFYLLIRYFVNSVNEASVITEIDTAGFLTSFYIFLRIFDSLFIIPNSLIIITSGYVSFKRVSNYILNSSPNYYISDNRFIGSQNMSLNINDMTNELDKDVVVLYRDATFTWVNNRKDLLTKNYQPYLKNLNFELRRGEIVIVSGSQGSGKSNFIKSVLGEMTLVGGIRAVVPLHTSMPIFYASQDIWIERGTIKSNILFGYRFDENIYNTVLKAVELEYDISTWEKGDMRVVSNYAHSLSGGQRVRMEMARAIYAYLIFNQVNTNYNDKGCSFLMCLDSSFNRLDPFVSKTVFNNLFNVKSGTLVRDDLSVILSISKQSLDKCISLTNLKNFPKIPVYNIVNGSMSYYSNLSDFVSNKNVNYGYSSKSSNSLHRMNYFLNDIFSLCLSSSSTRLGRRSVTKLNYEESFSAYVKNEFSDVNLNPYIIYMTPALFTFVLFILITIALTVLDNIKFVIATNLSDYLSKNINDYKNGQLVDLSEVKSRANLCLKIINIFISLIIPSSVIATMLMSVSSLISSRKIHEYFINRIFYHSPSSVKIKKQVSQILTYLAADFKLVDDEVCHIFSIVVTTLIQALIEIGTLFYLIPISIPFFVLTLIFVYKFILLELILSAKNLFLGQLECTAKTASVCENALSGSSLYRSFKKEWELFHELNEHQDYKMRCKFLTRSIKVWCSLISNWIFSFTTLFILVILIIFDRNTKYKLKVGYFALWLSMSMKVTKTFTKFSFNLAKLETVMFSLRRFQYFIPPGQKCVFERSINTNEEFLVVKGEKDNRFDKNKLLNRRFNEFKSDNKKFQRLKRMFFKPIINIVDITNYLPPKHVYLDIKRVYVYTSPDHNKDGVILKGITASAYRSDIIGIIGRTGGGKTTLLSVLDSTARFRTGQVLLDGKDLKDIPKNVIRQVIGVLPQLPFVFRGWTVRRFLDPRKLFSDDEINEALDKCGLLQFVNELQGGKKLDSVIINEEIELDNPKSEKSKRPNSVLNTDKPEKLSGLDTLETYYQGTDMLFSGSQLRTLSFARLVLYRYFYRIIIVDEPPFEENDENNVKSQDIVIPIYELLKKYFSHCTSFVTAHDANVLQVCTSVWVIHNGRLIRTCKREEISATDSISNIIEDIVKTYSKP